MMFSLVPVPSFLKILIPNSTSQGLDIIHSVIHQARRKLFHFNKLLDQYVPQYSTLCNKEYSISLNLEASHFFCLLQLKSNIPAYSVCVTYIRIQEWLMIVLITYFQCGLGNALVFKSNVDGENRELILAVVLIIQSKGHCYHNPDTLLPCIQV